MRTGRPIPPPAWLVVIVLLFSVGPAFADGVEVAILPSPAIVQPDETFDLELTIPVAGDSINGYETTIEYDNTVLTFIQLNPLSLQEGELMTDACGNNWHLFNEDNGTISISHILLCQGQKVTGPGVLYRLRFQASSIPDVTYVTVQHIEFYDAGTYVLPITARATVNFRM